MSNGFGLVNSSVTAQSQKKACHYLGSESHSGYTIFYSNLTPIRHNAPAQRWQQISVKCEACSDDVAIRVAIAETTDERLSRWRFAFAASAALFAVAAIVALTITSGVWIAAVVLAIAMAVFSGNIGGEDGVELVDQRRPDTHDLR